MKNGALLALSFAICTTHAMQRDEVDLYLVHMLSPVKLADTTLLHFTVDPHLSPSVLPNEQDDMERACTAAYMIHCKAQVDIQDKNGETPLAIATKNAEYLPKVYAVLKAGSVVQNWHPVIPAPQYGHKYTPGELAEIGQDPELKKALIVYRQAQKTLSYAFANQTAEEYARVYGRVDVADLIRDCPVNSTALTEQKKE